MMLKKETEHFHKLIIEDVTKYIKLNAWNSKLNGISVCEHSGYSVAYMGRIFKKHYGSSIKDFIKKEHFAYLEYELKYTGKSIGNIASFSNYASLSDLTKRFKRRYGIPPSQYRRRYFKMKNDGGIEK